MSIAFVYSYVQSADVRPIAHKFLPLASPLNPREAVPFSESILASRARMAHKYGVMALLTEATRRLESVYTDDFTAWSRHRVEIGRAHV